MLSSGFSSKIEVPVGPDVLPLPTPLLGGLLAVVAAATGGLEPAARHIFSLGVSVAAIAAWACNLRRWTKGPARVRILGDGSCYLLDEDGAVEPVVRDRRATLLLPAVVGFCVRTAAGAAHVVWIRHRCCHAEDWRRLRVRLRCP